MIGVLLSRKVIEGIARHILTTFGGWLVAQGYIDEGLFKELLGALMVIFGIIMSILNKKK